MPEARYLFGHSPALSGSSERSVPVSDRAALDDRNAGAEPALHNSRNLHLGRPFISEVLAPLTSDRQGCITSNVLAKDKAHTPLAATSLFEHAAGGRKHSG